MNDKTRKRIWPVSLIAILGVIAMLAVVWSSDSVPAQAQAPPPVWFLDDGLTATAHSDTQINLSWNTASGASSYKLERKTGSAAYSITGAALTGATHNDMGLMASTTYTYRITAINTSGETVGDSEAMATTMAAGTTGRMPDSSQDMFKITSSSTSASSTVELKVEIKNLSTGLPVGSSIELYLEDDYQVPALITGGAAYFVVTNTADAKARLRTGSGAPVLSISPVIVQTDDHFAGDDDYAIQVVIPDLCTSSNQAGQGTCDGQNGPEAGQTLTLVLTRAAGIKNPTEEKNYKVGAQILPLITDIQPNSGPNAASAAKLSVLAKVTLSDDDNKRGYELSVVGKGFNDGTTADAYVYTGGSISEWWDLLDCAQMVSSR